MVRISRKSRALAPAVLLSATCSLTVTVAQAEPASSEAEPAITVKEVPAAAIKQPPLDTKTLPSVVKNLEKHGVEIVGEFQAPGGLQAYAGMAQQTPLAIYLTPDGEHVIIGTMMDEEGADVTQPGLTKATLGPWTAATWDALSKSHWVADGSDDAAHIIYMFTDPNCPFCHKFWEQARPWVDEGKVQIRHILVGMLTHSSPGKAAAILQSDNPSQALHEHEEAGPDEGIAPLADIPEDVSTRLDENAELMKQMQIQGTPGIFYFDQEGALQIQRGAPLDQDLELILGPR